MKWIGSALFYVFVGIMSILPFWLLYVMADFTTFILRDVIKYRYDVIRKNLKLAFPDKSDAEIKILQKKVYKNLGDVFLEGLKTFNLGKEQVVKRHKIINPEVLEPYKKAGRSIIVVVGHYCNWEWGSLSAGWQTDFKIGGFYKPLRNPSADAFLRKSRSRSGTTLFSIYETSETFEKLKNEQYIYLMAADQSPSKRQLKYAIWINFLGINTPFLHGVEKHACNNNHVVAFVDIQRVKRGYYELEMDIITDQPAKLKPGELTSLYASRLEKVIRKTPENWLWSHKRWKHVN